MHLIRQRQKLCVSFQFQVSNKNDRLTIAFYESCLAWKISFIDNLFRNYFYLFFSLSNLCHTILQCIQVYSLSHTFRLFYHTERHQNSEHYNYTHNLIRTYLLDILKEKDLWYWLKFVLHNSNNNWKKLYITKTYFTNELYSYIIYRRRNRVKQFMLLNSRFMCCWIRNHLPSVQFSPVNPS